MASFSATIPVGYKQTKVGIIPKDWRIVELGTLCHFENGDRGTNYPSKSDFKDFGIPFINAGHLDSGRIKINSLDYITRTHFDLLRSGKCRNGDILFSLRGSLGKFGRINASIEPSAIASSLVIVRPKKSNNVGNVITSDFLHFYFGSRLCGLMIDLYAGGAAQPNLGAKELGNFLVPLPPTIGEQIAICEVLNDTDTNIQILKSLISKKKDIKQATMQKLLTGRTRLPGFSGEWEVKSLGEIGEITGAGVDKKIVEGEIAVRLVNYLDVYNRSFIYSNQLNHHVTAPASKATRCIVRKGDVFFTPTSEVRDDIAISAVAMEDILDATYSYHVVRLRIDDDWDLNFRAYAFQTKSFLDQAAVLSDGSGTRYVISLPNFRKLNVLVPEKQEQEAIGQLLYDMDAEIAALEQRLEKTKAIKQGMMQQLLTGRIRLVEPITTVEASE